MKSNEVDALANEIAALTDINAHNEAAIALALKCGRESEIALLNEIKSEAEKRGYGLPHDIAIRDNIVKRIISRLGEIEGQIFHNCF